MSSITRRFLKSPLGGALAAMLLASLLLGGAVAMSGSAATGEALNQTYSLDNDTTGVWVQIENSTAATNNNINATVYGINSSGETEIATVTLTANGANTTDLAEVSINPDTYNETRVVVPEPVESASAGLISRVGSGGGGGGSGPTYSAETLVLGALLALVVVGAGYAMIQN